MHRGRDFKCSKRVYTRLYPDMSADRRPNLSGERQGRLSLFLSPWNSSLLSHNIWECVLDGRVDSSIKLVFFFFFHHSVIFFSLPPFDQQTLPSTHLLFTPDNSPSICAPSFCPVPRPISPLTSSFFSAFALRQHLLLQPWLTGGYEKKKIVKRRNRGEEGREDCCRWTFTWSRWNPQSSHHGALMPA